MSIEQIMAEYEFLKYVKELEGPALLPPVPIALQWVAVEHNPTHQTPLEAIKAAVDKEWFEHGYRTCMINRCSDFMTGDRYWIKRG